MNDQKKILITGATGYVGGRLVPRLLAEGYRVRVLVREPGRLQGRSWIEQVEVYTGDVLDSGTLVPALDGTYGAYYLVHSMMSGVDFYQRDLQAARNFGHAAKQSNLARVIYLGGLGDPEADLSQHLRSRQQTGEALRQAGIPVIEFRAGVIVGAGSISFEMIRYLTERVPVMICPRWVFTRTQPIHINNVLDYLIAALQTPLDGNLTLEIGGPDVMSYGDMLLGYARVRGLKRWIIPVPVLTPRLSSYWVHWVTPIPAPIARALIEGLRNEAILRDRTAERLFPEIQPINYNTAVQQALDHLQASEVETVWSDALFKSQGDAPPVILTTHEGMIIERRQLRVAASPEAVFHAFTGLGGDRGWYYANWAWRLRGTVDRLIGGVGFRRGRRDPDQLRAGDAVDFCRVEHLASGRTLRLRAEMRLPGRAWLQFDAVPENETKTLLIQTATFAPKGLSGLLYWYLLYPIHARIFSGLIRTLAKRATFEPAAEDLNSADQMRSPDLLFPDSHQDVSLD